MQLETRGFADSPAFMPLLWTSIALRPIAERGVGVPGAGLILGRTEAQRLGMMSHYASPAAIKRIKARFAEKGFRGLARVVGGGLAYPGSHVTGAVPGTKAAAASLMAGSLAKIAYPVLTAFWVTPMLFDAVAGTAGILRRVGEAAVGLEMGGNYQDHQIGHTMRQRSLQAIHNSHLSARAAFGQEAMLSHS